MYMMMEYVLFVCLLICQASGFQNTCNQNFSEPGVIETPNFPSAYPPDATCEWAWTKKEGIWAVIFESFKINCWDVLYIKDLFIDKQLPYDCEQNQVDNVHQYYTKGPGLVIKFHTKKSNRDHTGFRIRVLYGRNIDELKQEVYDIGQTNKETSSKVNTIYTLLCTLVGILILIAIIVVLWFFNRRRRPSNHTLSVAVSMNHVTKGSGVVFKRSASTSDAVETTTGTVEIHRGKIKRTPSQRPWTTRATLSSTSSSNGDGVVDNVYLPMENIVHYQNQINRPLTTMVEIDPLTKPKRHPSNAADHQYPHKPTMVFTRY